MRFIGSEPALIETFKDSVRELVEMPIQDSSLDSAFSEHGTFLDCMEMHRRIRSLMVDLSTCVWFGYPQAHLQALQGHLALTKDLFLDLQRFCFEPIPSHNELGRIHGELNNWLSSNQIMFTDAIIRTTRYAALGEAATELDKMIEKRSAILFEQNEQYVNFKVFSALEIESASLWAEQRDEKVESYEKQHAELIADIKSKLGDIGSSHHAVKFKEEANRQYWEAFGWLFIAAVVSGFIIWYSFGLEATILAERDTARLWPMLALKGVVVSIASILLFICVRSFSACRHNMIVNRHRENALSTFKLFSEAAQDPDTRNAVLMEATKAVFAQAPSGYLKAANETNPSTHIVELVRSHSMTAKGDD